MMIAPLEKQKLEVLNGDRGPTSQHALRVGQALAMLSTVTAEPKTKPVTAAPTAADFNSLLDDVRGLYAALNTLRIAVQ
jgi:hypothetical protein